MWSSTLVRNYEYDNNSMDDFNAKSDNVQSESEDKIIELEEMVNNDLEYSEAEPQHSRFPDLLRPKKKCGINDGWFCNSHNDCKQCHDCRSGAICDFGWKALITVNGKWIKVNGSCGCLLGTNSG